MYIYYDKNYNLKEFITDVKAFQSASEVNNLYVYIEDLEDDDYSNATVRYKNYGTIDEKNKEIYVSNEYNFDGTEEKEIPFNREQDLLFFQYGKTYKFIKFVIPDEVLAENGVVLATIRLITEKTIQPLELLTFNVYNEVVAKDVGITLSQWNYLLKRLYLSGKFIKVVEDIGILNNNYDDYNDKDVIFDEAGQNFYLVLEVNGVKTIRLLLTRKSENSVNTIIVRDDKGKAEIETPVKNEDGSKSIVNIEYVNKVVEDLALRNDVVDVVGTYQDLQSYDTSKLTVNDVIKVLQDNTHDDASTYYKWNGTSFDFIGEEGPYYTQTEVDAKLDNKVDKVAKTDKWQLYGVGDKNVDLPNGRTINAESKAVAHTVMNRDGYGRAKINTPVDDLDISNKQYVDGRFDYVVLSKTKFILNYALNEDDRQLLLDFYDKHYGKTKIPLFVIDEKGDIASVRMNDTKYIIFSVLTYAENPIIMSVQLSLPNRKMESTTAYLHYILGYNAWRNDVNARIGVNSDNKLIITDEKGNQTPGQTPSVLVPPFSGGNGTYSLNGILNALRYEASTIVAETNIFIGNGNYVDNLVGDRFSFKFYNPDYATATFGWGIDTTDYSYHVVFNAKQDVGGDNGINPSHWTYDIVFPRKSGTVALTSDIDSKLDVIRYDYTKLVFDDNGQATLPADLKALIKPYFDNNKPFMMTLVEDDITYQYYLKGMRAINHNDLTFMCFTEDVMQDAEMLIIDMEANTVNQSFITFANLEAVVQYQPNVAKAVYTNNENKQQSMVAYSLLPGNRNLAQFDTNGHLYSNDPSIETHVTNKKYVDNLYFEHIITVKGKFAYAIINKISKKKTAVTSSIEMLALLNLEVNEVYPCFCGYISGNRVTHCVIYNGEKMIMGWLSPSGDFTATDDVGFVSDLVKPL